MLEGFVPEMGQSYAGRSRWVGGSPVIGLLGFNLRGKEIIEVRTFRCPACGYLESYAWKPGQSTA
jgi:hypothetical protein